MIAAALAAALVVLSASSGAPRAEAPDPEHAVTAARGDPRDVDDDAELLKNLELLERLDVLKHLELFDDDRG